MAKLSEIGQYFSKKEKYVLRALTKPEAIAVKTEFIGFMTQVRTLVDMLAGKVEPVDFSDERMEYRRVKRLILDSEKESDGPMAELNEAEKVAVRKGVEAIAKVMDKLFEKQIDVVRRKMAELDRQKQRDSARLTVEAHEEKLSEAEFEEPEIGRYEAVEGNDEADDDSRGIEVPELKLAVIDGQKKTGPQLTLDIVGLMTTRGDDPTQETGDLAKDYISCVARIIDCRESGMLLDDEELSRSMAEKAGLEAKIRSKLFPRNMRKFKKIQSGLNQSIESARPSQDAVA